MTSREKVMRVFRHEPDAPGVMWTGHPNDKTCLLYTSGDAVDAGQLFLAHNSGQLAHVLCKAGLVDVDGPVSYTHLDVYKRQA